MRSGNQLALNAPDDDIGKIPDLRTDASLGIVASSGPRLGDTAISITASGAVASTSVGCRHVTRDRRPRVGAGPLRSFGALIGRDIVGKDLRTH